MFDYELQQFETLARSVVGDTTTDDAPTVIHHERKQKRFAFNLDWNKPDERTIGQGLLKHKQERNMVGVIRDAVRLYFDLSAGNVDVLLELFPRIRDVIHTPPVAVGQGPKPMALPPIAPPAADDDMPALVMQKAASEGKAASNFLDSAFRLID